MRGKAILVCLFVVLFSSTTQAQVLWQVLDNPAPGSPDLTLPANAIDIVPVQVSGSVLATLATDSDLSLTLPNEPSLIYRVERLQPFPGGDLGIRATLDADSGHYVLSLTRDANTILATIYTPEGKYLLRAQRFGDDYVGFLFRESDAFRSIPIDRDDVEHGTALEVSNSGVSIQQSFSANPLLVGETLEVTVRVTNNSSATISGETLKIIFMFDRTEYLDSTSGCMLTTVQYSNGAARELHCPVNDLGVGATLSISYRVRTTTESITDVPSTVILDTARSDVFLAVANDVLKDTDNDGISDFNENLLGTSPTANGSGPEEGSNVDIDLLMLYTPRFVSDITTGNPVLEINQLLQQTNDIYAASGVGMTFRPVAYRQVSYTSTSGVRPILDAMQDRQSPFQDLDYLRATYGADLIILVDGIYTTGDACGVAEGGGFMGLGDMTRESTRGYLGALFMPGVNQQEQAECDVLTLAHELGHLMGLGHSRVEQRGGTFPWALGHGANGSFHTIMAYSTHYPDADSLPVFSNPKSNSCKGQACGVVHTDTVKGADAVLALQTTRFQIGRYIGTRPALSVATGSGASTSTTMSGGVTRTGGSDGPATTFGTNYSPSDVLSLVASINVDPAHAGLTGTTHIVIAAAGAGFFQVNSSGGYVPWDGNPATLLGTVQPRALQSIEELTAFRDLSFGSLGFPAISLTVYFAYSVASTGELVFSGSGVPVVIQ